MGIELKNTKVMNVDSAIKGMRNPLESWGKSDSGWTMPVLKHIKSEFIVGDKDFNLGLKLARAGSDHRKFMRQIFVSVDIEAPWYWWKEYATYKIGTVENSTSMMHKLGSRELTAEDFGWDKVTEYRECYLSHINKLIRQYETLNNKIERMVTKNVDTNLIRKERQIKKECWRELQQDMCGSFLYFRTATLNYEVLRNMYHSRKNHKLSEWHKFCDWIEELPYSQWITTK